MPREWNQTADAISRKIDTDDWQLNPEAFKSIDDMWGPHTVDCFASAANTQLEHFNSRLAELGSEVVDTFTTDWGGRKQLVVPPLCLVPRMIQHARVCRAMGTLVVPLRQSAPYWPNLWSEEGKFQNFVQQWCDLPLSRDLFCPTPSGSVLFDGSMPNTRVLAVNMSKLPQRHNLAVRQGTKFLQLCGAGPHLGGGVFRPSGPMLLLGGWAGCGWHLWLVA